MIWCGGGSDLLCCVFMWVNSFCVYGSAVLYLDIGSSSSSTHSDFAVCMVLLLLLTVFAVPVCLGDIFHYFLLLLVPCFVSLTFPLPCYIYTIIKHKEQ